MGYSLSVAALLDRAERTRTSAARLARPGRWFTTWRERRCLRAVDAFLQALHHVPPHEASKATDEQAACLRERVDGIVEHLEVFLSSPQASTGRRLERSRRLAARVYELRRAFEAIARRATPNPGIVDLRREERLRRANQPRR